MAFTAEDKLKIKQLAEQMMAADPALNAGKAAQSAILQLFPASDVATKLVTPQAITPGPARPATTVTPVQGDMNKTAYQFGTEQNKYIALRSQQLQSEGYGSAEADTIARKEIDVQFKKPLPLGYGTQKERADKTMDIPVVGPAVTATPGQVKGSTFIDWNKFQEQYKQSTGSDNDQARKAADAYKAAYDAKLLEDKAGTGAPTAEASRTAFEAVQKELARIPEVIADKKNYRKDTLTGSADPWIRTFQKQVDSGEGIPAFTPIQEAYLNEQYNYEVKQEANRIAKDNKRNTIQYIVMPDGSKVKYTAGIAGQVPQGARIVTEAKTQDQLLEEARQTVEPSILTTGTIKPMKTGTLESVFWEQEPLGGKKETTAAWILRSAMTLPNALAGAASELAYNTIEGRTEARTAKGYAPGILGSVQANIAEGKGYFGEVKEAADLASVKQYSEPLYYGTLAGGFAADLLDPSMDLAKGTVVAGKQTATNLKTISGLYRKINPSQVSSALADAAKAGANDFIESSFLSAVVPVDRRFVAGDFRNFAVKKVSDELNQVAVLDQLLTDGKTTEEALVYLKQQPVGVANQEVIKQLQLAVDKNIPLERVIDNYSGRFLNEELATTIRKANQELDAITTGVQDLFSVLRRKDLARTLGALAKVDPKVEALLRAVDANPIAEIPKLNQYLTAVASDSDAFSLLKKGITHDLAAKVVYDATHNIPGFDNLVAVTKNTYATKADTQQILKVVQDTELAKLSQQFGSPQLVPVNKTVSYDPTKRIDSAWQEPISSPARLVPAYKLTEDQRKFLVQTLDNFQTERRISAGTYRSIKNGLIKNVITIEDYRRLLDAMIDSTAEGMNLVGRSTITRSRDLARLPVQEVSKLLEPMERRTFSKDLFRTITQKYRGDDSIVSNLSVGQKGLIDAASTRISSMDAKLRKDFQDFRNNPEVAKQYGIDNATALRNDEVLSLLIVGPKGTGYEVSRLQELLTDSLSDVFFAQETKENILDVFLGSKLTRNSKVFNDDALESLNIVDYANHIIKNPEQFLVEFKKLVEEADKLLEAPAMLRFPTDKIVRLSKKGAPLTNQIQVATYYRAEAKRIIDEVLASFINEEIGRISFRIDEHLNPNYLRTVDDQLDKLGRFNKQLGFDFSGFPQQTNNWRTFNYDLNLIQNRIQNRMMGNPTDQITDRDILEVFYTGSGWDAPIDEVVALLKNDPEFRRTMEVIFEVADDVGNSIIRSNNLRTTGVDLNKVDTLFKDLSAGDTKRQLDLILGEEVSQQLFDALGTGIQKLSEDLLKAGTGRLPKTNVQKATALLTKVYNNLMDLQYMLLLNMRSRFHFANMLTGPDIYYSTTGRLPDPRDLIEAAQVLGAGKTIPDTQILFRDAAGRPYTQGEVQQILKTATGRSVYDMGTPGLALDRLDRMLSDTRYKPTTGATERIVGTIKDNWDSFKELPQNEDLLYRYAALKSALIEGRTMDEAVALARSSMFDVGTLTDIERQAKRLFMFYGFMRNNLLNTIQNLTSFAGIKRLGKTERLRQNLSTILTDKETEEYAPEYTAARIIWDKYLLDANKNKDVIITSPPLPSIDGIVMLGNILNGNFGEVTGQNFRPEFQALIGIEDSMDFTSKQVPAEHVNILKYFVDDPTDSINIIMQVFGGDPVVPRPGTQKEGAVNGVVYPLVLPSQQAAYKKFISLFKYAGAEAPLTDYSKTLTLEGTKGQVLSDSPIASRLAFATAAGTPVAMTSPEGQSLQDRLARLNELRSTVTAMKNQRTAGYTAEQEDKTVPPSVVAQPVPVRTAPVVKTPVPTRPAPVVRSEPQVKKVEPVVKTVPVGIETEDVKRWKMDKLLLLRRAKEATERGDEAESSKYLSEYKRLVQEGKDKGYDQVK